MTFKKVSTFIILMFIFYLMGSFIALSFNPMKWDLIGRSIFAFTGTLIAAVITVVLNDYEDDK